jgi:hypothetical protein
MAAEGGFLPFPICPTYDAHGVKAAIYCLKPDTRRCAYFGPAAGSSKGRGVGSSD